MNPDLQAALAQVQAAITDYRHNKRGSDAKAEAASRLKQQTEYLNVAARNA